MVIRTMEAAGPPVSVQLHSVAWWNDTHVSRSDGRSVYIGCPVSSVGNLLVVLSIYGGSVTSSRRCVYRDSELIAVVNAHRSKYLGVVVQYWSEGRSALIMLPSL